MFSIILKYDEMVYFNGGKGRKHHWALFYWNLQFLFGSRDSFYCFSPPLTFINMHTQVQRKPNILANLLRILFQFSNKSLTPVLLKEQ